MTPVHFRTRVRWPRLVVALLLGAGGMLVGCQSTTPPSEAGEQYRELMQIAAVAGEARPDTSFFWLRNTGNARARSLMLELGVDFLYYDRGKGVLCLWSGEGLWPARGYVTSVPAGHPQADSVGALCDIEGECSATPVTDTWARFNCG